MRGSLANGERSRVTAASGVSSIRGLLLAGCLIAALTYFII